MRASNTAKKLRSTSETRLQSRAADNLRFIRETMETAKAFTAVPGWGGVAIGVCALATLALASRVETFDRWLALWLGCAALALILGVATMILKARGAGTPVVRGPGRGFVLSLSPPVVAGVVLTILFYRSGFHQAIPGSWLLLYGTGVVTGGAFSVRPVPVMGLGFMALGAVALFLPLQAAQLLMGLGFGGLHLVFGAWIAKEYGG